VVSGARLVRALSASAVAHGCSAEVILGAEHDWASATFAGSRVEVTARLPAGQAAQEWIAALPEVDLPMPRQFARSVRVVAREDHGEQIALRVEAVVLED
jgi:hypothetical protein